MIYFDYSATTPVNEEVLDTYLKVSKEYIGNSNSLHKLGVDSRKLEESATKQIADLLHVQKEEIIYTSGASESNNTVIKGIAFQYQNRGRHILTTELEHSSILEPLNYLKTLGFEIEYIRLKKDGTIDLEDFKKKMRDTTILVTISSVSSELGILNPIDEIGKIIKNYPKCFFHVDMTQSIGKVPVTLEYVHFASFSAHKFYGPKGIGCLIKKVDSDLTPLIHGGKSTTSYRSGTPATPLIASMSKALRLALSKLEEKEEYVRKLNTYLKESLQKIDGITINSTEKSIPHILNLSVKGIKPETLLHALERHDIFLSTQSACSKKDHPSKAVYALTMNKELASTSLRISISYLSTKEECDTLLHAFKEEIQNLRIK